MFYKMFKTMALVAVTLGLSITVLANKALKEIYKGADAKVRAKAYPAAMNLLKQGLEVAEITAFDRYTIYSKMALVSIREKNKNAANKYYAKARNELEQIVTKDDLKANKRFDYMNRIAQTFERENKLAEARRVYANIINDNDVTNVWKQRSELAYARTFYKEKEYDKASSELGKLLKKKDITASQRCAIMLQIASAAMAGGRAVAGETVCQNALKLPGLNDRDKFNIYSKMAQINQRLKNVSGVRKSVESMAEFAKKPRQLQSSLQQLALISLQYNVRDNVIWAYEQLLDLPTFKGKWQHAGVFLLANAYLANGNIEQARKLLVKAVADKKLPAIVRYQADMLLATLDAVVKKVPVSADTLTAINKRYATDKLSDADKLKALNGVAKAMVELRAYDYVQQFIDAGDKLIAKKPEKKILCEYMEKAPMGASGWAVSKMINNDKYRETRFEDYNAAAAARLIVDVSTERVVSKDAKKQYYFDNTAFYMCQDRAGWHMYVLCGEENLDNILADGGSAGALEMYFTPGHGQVYYQWIIRLPSGEVSGQLDWNSPHRNFRSLKGKFKTETITYGDKIGTYIFIPWDVLYDIIPFDTGEEWRFGIIRWSPKGGITWGGQVHEVSKWGKIDWKKPGAEQVLTIRRDIARKAWGKYKKSRKELVGHWQDDELGDPQFYNTTLKPVVEKLDKAGEQMKEISKLSAEQVNSLFKNTVPDWMEFSYLVDELRQAYLTQMFMKK